MQELQVFNNDTFTVHTTLQRQTPYFRAADVVRQLGYANGPQAVRKNVRDKYVTTLAALRKDVPQSTAPSAISRGDGGVSPAEIPQHEGDSDLYLSEAGMYALILKSKRPEAEAFQDWICEEVLPQIRSTGCYQRGRSGNTRFTDDEPFNQRARPCLDL